MKEYLFRGKKTSDAKWIDGTLITWPAGKAQIVVPGYEYGKMVAHAVIPESVGQWTTKLDKAGTRIYAGDVLMNCYHDPYGPISYCETRVLVVFQEGAFGWIGETGKFYPFATEPLPEFTVIGNIYDNPELIQKKKP